MFLVENVALKSLKKVFLDTKKLSMKELNTIVEIVTFKHLERIRLSSTKKQNMKELDIRAQNATIWHLQGKTFRASENKT